MNVWLNDMATLDKLRSKFQVLNVWASEYKLNIRVKTGLNEKNIKKCLRGNIESKYREYKIKSSATKKLLGGFFMSRKSLALVVQKTN